VNKSEKVLLEDLAHYRREGKSGKDRTYAFLRDAIERHLDNTHQEKNVQARKQGYKQHKNIPDLDTAPAAAAEAKAKAKAKAAAKAKVKAEAAAAAEMQTSAVAAAAAQAAAAAFAKGKAKGKGDAGKKGDQPKGGDAKAKGGEPRAFCWFHQPKSGTTCTRGTACKFPHTIVSKAEFEAMPRPRSMSAAGRAPSGGPSASPGGTPRGKGVKKGKGKGKDDKGKKVPFCCHQYLKEGKCDRGDNCKFPHMSREEYNAAKAKLNN